MTTLITGGMGFIGLHTAKAFVDAGEDVVITYYQTWREPSFIKDEFGKRVIVEKADVSQPSASRNSRRSTRRRTSSTSLSRASPRSAPTRTTA